MLLEILTEFPQRLLHEEKIYFGEKHIEKSVSSIRRHGEDMLLRLEGVEDRDAAEKLRGAILFTRMDDLPPLPEGVYYHHQIEGMAVVTEAGEELGRVSEIIETGANDVYVVKGGDREILLPAIPQVIKQVILAEKKMIVNLMEGL